MIYIYRYIFYIFDKKWVNPNGKENYSKGHCTSGVNDQLFIYVCTFMWVINLYWFYSVQRKHDSL